jgi:hypothetical protein
LRDCEQDESDGGPEHDERAAQASQDVIFQVPQLGGVVAVSTALHAEVEGWEEEIGLSLGLGEGDSGFEAAGDRQHVAILADAVVDVGGEEVDVGARGVDGAEVEGLGEDADHGEGGVT